MAARPLPRPRSATFSRWRRVSRDFAFSRACAAADVAAGAAGIAADPDDQLLEDSKTLGDCGFTSQTARPQAPATVGLALRNGEDSFEGLRIEPFSSPPELPDVMKPQDSTGAATDPPLP
ncbi:PREDICTED: transcription elongation factor B polypeptide 2 [Pseudopodoces humilis]|uniref:transcription elongation factor B polypeptide 2 n=1 Tax=Pseudopodoces humilis TaxID=181119 RepID=UPI0006B78E35|nr:PREDICTED: transcription elongation factor B polypeptide 2 [Pseudopodoces humilis]